jgi:hypothetical protein
MNEWLSILFFIGLLLVIADHNSKEKYVHVKNSKDQKQRSKSF